MIVTQDFTAFTKELLDKADEKFEEINREIDEESEEKYHTKFNPEHTKLSLYDSKNIEIGYFYVEKIEGQFDKKPEEKKAGESENPDIFLMFQVKYDLAGDFLFYQDGKSLVKYITTRS